MADDAGITVVNLPSAARMLREHPDLLLAEFQIVTDRLLLEVGAELAEYPDAPPNSSYRRTGTLGRLWTTARPEWQASGSGFEGKLGNATPYGPYVQGERQALVHRGRWKTVRVIEDARRASIIGRYAAATRRVAEKVNKVTA